MNLDNLTVDIRPRAPWESIDIGFVIARRWYWRLWFLWLINALPVLVLVGAIAFLLPGSAPKWTILLFWLCKPLYEPGLLYWVSQALFGTRNTLGATLKELREKMSFKRVLLLLLFRLSLFRSFSLSVLLLEGLEGKKSRQRLSILRDSSEAVFLTILSFLIELVLTFSLMGVLYWIVPEDLRWIDFDDFIFTADSWIILISYVIACSIVAPLYICSGFMLYISRRVELEAWDIEIGFKRIRQRLDKRKNGVIQKTIVSSILFALLVTCFPDYGISSASDPEDAKETIEQVLEDRVFGEEVTKYRWQPIEREKKKPDSDWLKMWERFFEALADFFDFTIPHLAKYSKILLWCCAGILIAFLVVRYSHIRRWLDARFIRHENGKRTPKVMFGMDLRPQSLPDDISGTCSTLLAQGKKREAMSLLYRGTLSRLINSYALQILSSYTEQECCSAVKKNRPSAEAHFFNDLTSLWVIIAYGHKDPDTIQCHNLVDCWKNLYEVQS